MRQLKLYQGSTKAEMVTLSSEIQAIHRKCIRLLIITARFNCRSRCLMLTSWRSCDLVTSHLSPFTADRSLSPPRRSFQSVWWSDSSLPPVSAHLGMREDKRLSEGIHSPEQALPASITAAQSLSVPPARIVTRARSGGVFHPKSLTQCAFAQGVLCRALHLGRIYLTVVLPNTVKVIFSILGHASTGADPGSLPVSAVVQ